MYENSSMSINEKWSNKLWRIGAYTLEEEMATYSSSLAWEIPWTEEPGGLQSTGSQKSRTQLKQLNNNPLIIWISKRYFENHWSEGMILKL